MPINGPGATMNHHGDRTIINHTLTARQAFVLGDVHLAGIQVEASLMRDSEMPPAAQGKRVAYAIYLTEPKRRYLGSNVLLDD